MGSYFSNEFMHKAMLDGLNQHVRAALKERFQAQAEIVIDEAIEAAMKEFEMSLTLYRNNMSISDVLEIIIKDTRTKEMK